MRKPGRPRICFHERGKHKYCYLCRPAADEKRRERNRKFIQEYREAHPCIQCGEADPVVLDFHHIKGRKSFPIAKAVCKPYSLKTLMKEIAKCIVLCANCHRRVTHQLKEEK